MTEREHTLAHHVSEALNKPIAEILREHLEAVNRGLRAPMPESMQQSMVAS